MQYMQSLLVDGDRAARPRRHVELVSVRPQYRVGHLEHLNLGVRRRRQRPQAWRRLDRLGLGVLAFAGPAYGAAHAAAA